jgi:hypothetical protein
MSFYSEEGLCRRPSTMRIVKTSGTIFRYRPNKHRDSLKMRKARSTRRCACSPKESHRRRGRRSSQDYRAGCRGSIHAVLIGLRKDRPTECPVARIDYGDYRVSRRCRAFEKIQLERKLYHLSING